MRAFIVISFLFVKVNRKFIDEFVESSMTDSMSVPMRFTVG